MKEVMIIFLFVNLVLPEDGTSPFQDPLLTVDTKDLQKLFLQIAIKHVTHWIEASH